MGIGGLGGWVEGACLVEWLGGLVAWVDLMGRGEEKPNALPPLLKILAAVGCVLLKTLVLELDEGLLSFS